MVDAIDQGIAFGYQRRQHQAGGSTQVGGHYRGTLQRLDASDDGSVAFDLDLRAHAVHFVDVHEAVFEDRLDHCTSAFGNGVERDELRLHVGRERRVRGGTQVDGFRPFAVHVQLDPVFASVDVGAGFLEFFQYGFKDGRISVLDLDAAAGHGSGNQVGAGLDTVRHHAVVGRVQALDAIDDDGVGTSALDLAAHGVDEVGQVDHFRLARGVLQHAAALGQGSGHHDVLGTGHADGVEEEVRTAQATLRRLGLDVAGFDFDLRAHGLEATDVQVDRARANGATARQGHFGLTETGDHRAQHQDRGAHGLDQLVRCNQGLDGARVDLDRQLFVDHRLDAHAAEQLDHGGDVVQVRQVAHGDRAVGQQGRRQNRQGCVLRARNADLAIKASAASNNQFVHWNLAATLAQVRSAQAALLKNFMVTAWMLPLAIHGFR